MKDDSSRSTEDSGLHPRPGWGWFVALGVGLLLLASFAFINVIAATMASVVTIGVLMIIGAVGQIVHAFQVKRWGGFFAWLLAGLLYGVAGIMVFKNPVLAAATLTLLLACALIASGIMRLVLSIRLRKREGWGWMLVSGVITILAGMIFVAGWPVNTLWLLGTVLAIDLAFQGATSIAFGLALKSAR